MKDMDLIDICFASPLNNEITRKYYETNGFKDLFSTEQQEKEHLGILPDNELKTRLMYFDLIPNSANFRLPMRLIICKTDNYPNY